MYLMVKSAAIYYGCKIDSWFRKKFGDEAGGGELIAALVIVGIVLVLAFAFRDQLANLVKQIWNDMVRDQKETTDTSGLTWE